MRLENTINCDMAKHDNKQLAVTSRRCTVNLQEGHSQLLRCCVMPAPNMYLISSALGVWVCVFSLLPSCAQGRDISDITNPFWKKFYEREFRREFQSRPVQASEGSPTDWRELYEVRGGERISKFFS